MHPERATAGRVGELDLDALPLVGSDHQRLDGVVAQPDRHLLRGLLCADGWDRAVQGVHLALRVVVTEAIDRDVDVQRRDGEGAVDRSAGEAGSAGLRRHTDRQRRRDGCGDQRGDEPTPSTIEARPRARSRLGARPGSTMASRPTGSTTTSRLSRSPNTLTSSGPAGAWSRIARRSWLATEMAAAATGAHSTPVRATGVPRRRSTISVPGTTSSTRGSAKPPRATPRVRAAAPVGVVPPASTRNNDSQQEPPSVISRVIARSPARRVGLVERSQRSPASGLVR